MQRRKVDIYIRVPPCAWILSVIPAVDPCSEAAMIAAADQAEQQVKVDL